MAEMNAGQSVSGHNHMMLTAGESHGPLIIRVPTLRKGRAMLSGASAGAAAATGLSSGMETGSLILGLLLPTAKSTSIPKGTPPGDITAYSQQSFTNWLLYSHDVLFSDWSGLLLCSRKFAVWRLVCLSQICTNLQLMCVSSSSGSC